jgi:transcriptional regulator with XRE-family HTH domain
MTEETVVLMEELREFAGMTQKEVAQAMQRNKAAISKLEISDNPRLQAVLEYIKALGGKIHLEVTLDEKRYNLVLPSQLEIPVDPDSDGQGFGHIAFMKYPLAHRRAIMRIQAPRIAEAEKSDYVEGESNADLDYPAS